MAITNSLTDPSDLGRSENPCIQGMADSARRPCEKTCGSINCKRSLLRQKCPGIYIGACTGTGEKQTDDKVKANSCIEGNFEEHMDWLKNIRTDWSYIPADGHLDN